MAEEHGVKQGTLCMRNKGQFTKKLKEIFVVLYASSRCGVARIELYENAKTSISGSFRHMLVGSEIMKVHKIPGTSREDMNSFVVATKEQQYVFCSKNAHESDQWVKAIQETIIQPMHAPSPVVKQNSNNSVTIDNDVYASAVEVVGPTGFEVTPEAETRKKLAVDGPINLTVEQGHITLIAKGGNRIARWGVQELRRIGYSDNDFHVEAGRKTETGEGEFKFITMKGKQIYSLMERQKTYCRSTVAKGRYSTTSVGMVTPPLLKRQSPTFTIGGHIYEELDTLLPPEIGGDARPAVKEKHPSGQNSPKSETITLRLSSAMAGEVASPKSPPSTVRFPNKTEYAGGAAASPSSPLAVAVLPNTKSPLTKNGLVHGYNETTTAGSNFADTPSNHVYTEVTQYKEAWKKYGVGDSENTDYDKEGAFQSLQRFRHSDIEVDEAHYANLPSPQSKPQNVSPIYAKITRKKTEKH